MLCPGELSGSEGSLRERVEELRAALAELDAERDQMQAVADTRAQECAQLQERVEAMVGVGENVGCWGGGGGVSDELAVGVSGCCRRWRGLALLPL